MLLVVKEVIFTGGDLHCSFSTLQTNLVSDIVEVVLTSFHLP